jgi:hypothetical protein
MLLSFRFPSSSSPAVSHANQRVGYKRSRERSRRIAASQRFRQRVAQRLLRMGAWGVELTDYECQARGFTAVRTSTFRR